MNWVIIGVLMGVAGTLAMDLWALLLHRLLGQPLPNWGNVGRWAAEVPKGRLFHSDIGEVPRVSGETAIGWAVHYGVGILYGILFLMIVGPQWLIGAPFVPLWIFALITIAAGWFLLLPGMGLGWAASRTDNPWRVRGMGLVAHTVFALGMWGAALVFTT
ncbi:DUF2938 family protein [Marivita sp. XM-24bin2]|jgi:hypothetical protein|uniref:DUF2938 family protein n=1 Tax=unclassified Marivita TaxID=2632480 RepID=UPI000D7B2735|nr:DUF2938 family protein [Marivita sp. XM-24bin2]MCR9107817.1 DUF2938 domain-containing protein [Paracoccaceae bacterium]PWL35844.1 MAG: DUF2938 domain-containing protein [Marivita sp. XM-24bin2]